MSSPLKFTMPGLFRQVNGNIDSVQLQMQFQWKIEDFYFLSTKTQCNSPIFNFFGASWYLTVIPNDENEDENENESSDWLGVYLVRSDTGPAISLAFILKTTSEEIQNEFHFRHSFLKKNDAWGSPKGFSRLVLQNENSSTHFSITCSMRHLVPNRIARNEKLLKDLKGLLLNVEKSDVIIQIEGEDFRLHRNILESRTPVFSSMIKQEITEKTTGPVSIDSCKADVFGKFVDYIYTGAVEDLSLENVFGLYEVADKYQVSELKEDCSDYMKTVLTVETFCLIAAFALRYYEKELFKAAADFFSSQVKEIIKTDKWQEFLRERPSLGNKLYIKAFAHFKKK